MVDYVVEVNAQNQNEQGRLNRLIKALAKHAHGDVICEDVNRRMANLEQLMWEGFVRIGERLKAIWDHADAMTCRLSELEQRLMELEAVPLAPTMAPLPPSPIIFVSAESSPHPWSEDDAGTEGTEGSIAEVAVSKDENDAEHESRPALDEPMDNMEDGQANTEDDSRDSDTKEPPESTTQGTVQTPQTGSALGGMEAVAERGGMGSSGTASGEMSIGTASGGMASGGMGAGGAASGGADKPILEPIAETSVLDTPARPQEKVSEADAALAPTTATDVAGGARHTTSAPFPMLISETQHSGAGGDQAAPAQPNPNHPGGDETQGQ
ncbi:hypothetical protein DXG01_005956 [Tephrocybe rancida]|nr:hypothetical protein DXG01_005956 [Tephrocybe rancida]